VQVGLDASKVVITKLKLDKDRRAILARKDSKKSASKGKGKYTAEEMAEVD
jgi:large subunit ribosomal protein L26e